MSDIIIILQIVFIVLKITETITWSWWAVFTPVWCVVGLLLLAVVFDTFLNLARGVEKWHKKHDYSDLWK
jgi:hypothetical protein